MKVIAISGKAQSGKGTLALALLGELQRLGYSPQVLSYAEGVKLECAEFLAQLGIPFRQIHFWGDARYKNSRFFIFNPEEAVALHPRFQEYLSTYGAQVYFGRGNLTFQGNPCSGCEVLVGQFRTLMQWWGTEYRRKDNDTYWVDQLQAKLQASIKEHDVTIIEDLRFPIEYNHLKELGATLVHVTRLGGDFEETAAHYSEQALDSPEYRWDYAMVNASTREAFARQGHALARKIMECSEKQVKEGKV